jgi:hypothetical protein
LFISAPVLAVQARRSWPSCRRPPRRPPCPLHHPSCLPILLDRFTGSLASRRARPRLNPKSGARFRASSAGAPPAAAVFCRSRLSRPIQHGRLGSSQAPGQTLQ